MLDFARTLCWLDLPGPDRGRRIGQALVEYALLLGLVAVVLVVALASLREQVAGVFVQVGDLLAAPDAAASGGDGDTGTSLLGLGKRRGAACPAPSNGRPCR